jgi:hypothetical protein
MLKGTIKFILAGIEVPEGFNANTHLCGTLRKRALQVNMQSIVQMGALTVICS